MRGKLLSGLRVVRRGLEKLLEERRRERNRVIEKARSLAETLRRSLGKITVFLYGSYSRGDFNVWSDIDLLVISDRFRDMNPLERLSLIQELLPPRFEARCFTPGEFRAELKKPWWRKIVDESIVLADDYNLINP